MLGPLPWTHAAGIFGKKKQADPKSGKAHDLALLDRQLVDMNARNALDDRGCPTTVATITSVDLADVIHIGGEGYDFMDNQEFLVEAAVGVPDGDPFTASFPIYLEGVPESPEVGEAIDVVYDPADHSQVRASITWRRKYRTDATPRSGGGSGPRARTVARRSTSQPSRSPSIPSATCVARLSRSSPAA